MYLSNFYGLSEVADYWHQVVKINDYQKKRFAEKIINFFKKNIKEIKISILGWSFKANTNDSRESAAIYVSDILIRQGALLNIYDPMVKEEQIYNDLEFLWKKESFSNERKSNYLNQIKVFDNAKSCLKNTKAIAILTEWEEFKLFDWNNISLKAQVFDGRYILNN